MSDVRRMVEHIAELRRSGDWNRLPEAIPYARFLGISLDCSSGAAVGRLAYADMLVGNPALPALHGGTIGALLESTAVFQLLYEQESVALPKTINITVDYLRSGRAVDTFARGVVTRHGRRVANVRVEAWQDDADRPIAIAWCHFLLEPPV